MKGVRRVCVVMGDNRPIYPDARGWSSYPSLTFAINRRFAEAKSWDFRYEQYQLPLTPWGRFEAFSTASRQHRAPTWVKLMAVDRALAEGYDVVFWIDTDCIFYHHEADWTDVLNKLTTHHVVAWLDKPFHEDQICAGFFGVRSNPEVRTLLRDLWTKPSKLHWKPFHEQAELNHFFKQAGDSWLHAVDEPMFHLESENQRLLHIASFDTLQRIPVFSGWLRQRGVGLATDEEVRMAVRPLDVDSYDEFWSQSRPSPLDFTRRVLRSLRSFIRSKVKIGYRTLRPLR